MTAVKKLFIESYSDHKLSKDKMTFTVQLNPESYSLTHKIEYAKKQAVGTTARPMKVSKYKPRSVDFEFYFDETGAVEKSGGKQGITENLEKEAKKRRDLGVDYLINEFKKCTFKYYGKKHRPRYLKIRWGNFLFKCCLESLDINYVLFSSDGVPLRAKVKVKFVEFMRNDLMVKKQNDQSPDVTHFRTINEGDTLPLLAQEIYGDSKYYLAVAEVNKIYNFRHLQVGSTLYFPPIEK